MSMNRLRHAPARGFTLIEVLIAVVLLSIGLLGVAGMQLSGLRYHQGAYLRAQATALLGDMADRMRTNPQGVGAGSYNNITINTTASGWQSSLPADPDCTTNACTPAQQANLDHRQWGLALGQLPRAIGTVRRTTDQIFTITIAWQDLADSEAAARPQEELDKRLEDLKKICADVRDPTLQQAACINLLINDP